MIDSELGNVRYQAVPMSSWPLSHVSNHFCKETQIQESEQRTQNHRQCTHLIVSLANGGLYINFRNMRVEISKF